MAKEKGHKWIYLPGEGWYGYQYNSETQTVEYGKLSYSRSNDQHFYMGPTRRLARYNALGTTAKYALIRAGFRTIDDVAHTPDEDLLKCVGVGKVIVEHVRRFIPYEPVVD